ncbi:MAG: sensor histidine kinase [Terriglobia bacterium]
MSFTVASRSALFSAPLALSEVQRRERVLSGSRVLVAICSLIFISAFPGVQGRYTLAAHLILFTYLVHSLLTFILIRVYKDCGSSFLLSVHGADILWPAIISLFAGGPNSPFFALCVFAVLAAGYRWGLQETLATALAETLLFLIEAAFATSSSGSQFHLLHGQLRVDTFIVQILGLLILGGLLGYPAEREKALHGESMAMRRILQKVNPEASVNEALEDVLRAVLMLFGAKHVRLALDNLATERAFIWEGGDAQPGHTMVDFSELGSSDRERHFFPMPGKSLYLQQSQRGEPYRMLALDDKGRRLDKISCVPPGSLFSENPFRTLFAVTFTLGKEWSGRIFLFDVRRSAALEADLRFFQELVAEVAPALHNIYLLRRFRSRARAIERTRIARDIHDGVIQSVIALEMQVDVLRRQAVGVSLDAAEKLENVRNLLRQEVVNLRELMQQLRLGDIAPEQLLTCVRDIVDRFRRETGIKAEFSSDFDTLALPPRVSREVAQIVHEALANVRKHSGARNVRIHLATEENLWKLTIEDDGRGFEFSGRLSGAELDMAHEGPQVLKERVHSIKGELAIESNPSQGARLEIRFAPKVYG